MSLHLSEQELQRRQKLSELKAMGIDPYPADEFKVNVTAADIRENYERDKLNYKDISIAGRIMSIRDMGKACFAVIQDTTGRIQLYIRKDDICPGEDKTMYDIVWKKLIDIGDIIGVNGYGFTTKTGENEWRRQRQWVTGRIQCRIKCFQSAAATREPVA